MSRETQHLPYYPSPDTQAGRLMQYMRTSQPAGVKFTPKELEQACPGIKAGKVDSLLRKAELCGLVDVDTGKQRRSAVAFSLTIAGHSQTPQPPQIDVQSACLQALRKYGPCTTAELERYTGVRNLNPSAALNKEINSGKVLVNKVSRRNIQFSLVREEVVLHDMDVIQALPNLPKLEIKSRRGDTWKAPGGINSIFALGLLFANATGGT